MWEGFEGNTELVYVPDCSAVDSARPRHPFVLDKRAEFADRDPNSGRSFVFTEPQYNRQKESERVMGSAVAGEGP